MFDDARRQSASQLLNALQSRSMMVATAESCTGGLISALLTEVPGSSAVVERAYITYSNEAKMQCLGVPEEMLRTHGAVSEEVARAMATGALANAAAQAAISVTGIAGPGGETPGKPVGLVHIAAALAGHATAHRECRFGDIGRAEVRMATVDAAIELLMAQLQASDP
ncbi:MAG: CinA family protein [Pseudomonadota bacterium]